MGALRNPQEQTKGLLYYSITIAYFGLIVLAFFSSAERKGIIPMLPTMTRYACDVGIIVLAVLYFLITFMQSRLKVVGKLVWIWSIPFFCMALTSLAIWIFERAELNYILRGLINVGCAELNVLAAGCAIWLFGERVVDYTFFGAIGGVLLVAARAVIDFGIGVFFREYIILLLSFAAKTGAAMRYMELHDLGQAFGLFLMFYLVRFLKSKQGFLFIIVSFFFFTLSLKRIDVLAIAAAFFIGWFVNRLTFARRWYFIIAFEIALVVFVYAYLIIIKKGYYGIIMERLGIDTMTRDVVYDYYKDFFDMSPTFGGRGLRYIYVYMTESDDVIRVNRSFVMHVFAIHNEYMTYFIELGFWGFILWLWSNSWQRINAIRREFGWEATTFTLMVVFYFFITYATDNTFFYYCINYVGYVTSGFIVLTSRKAIEYG